MHRAAASEQFALLMLRGASINESSCPRVLLAASAHKAHMRPHEGTWRVGGKGMRCRAFQNFSDEVPKTHRLEQEGLQDGYPSRRIQMCEQ